MLFGQNRLFRGTLTRILAKFFDRPPSNLEKTALRFHQHSLHGVIALDTNGPLNLNQLVQ